MVLPTSILDYRPSPSAHNQMRKAPARTGAFIGAPGMARSAVTGAIWSGWYPTDDLEVRVLYGPR
jgi:hypothetical protein